MRFTWHSVASIGAISLFALTSSGIAFQPPVSQVINVPAVIPTDGVLAIGTVSSFPASRTTVGGEPSLVSDGAETAHTGVFAELSVALGGAANLEQKITTWKADGELPPGPLVVLFPDLDGGTGVTSTSSLQVEASNGTTALGFSNTELTLDATQVVNSEIACGETFDISASTRTVYLTTSFRMNPNLTFRFALEGGNQVVSQHFFRLQRVDLDEGREFGPVGYVGGDGSEWASTSAFPAGQEEYCLTVDVLSLATGGVESHGPFCVADDGRDWSEVTLVTDEQIDAVLIGCPEPPAALLPRYCALRAAQLVGAAPVAACEGFTQAELDAALAADIDVAALDGAGAAPGTDPVPPGTMPPVVNDPNDPADPDDPNDVANPDDPLMPTNGGATSGGGSGGDGTPPDVTNGVGPGAAGSDANPMLGGNAGNATDASTPTLPGVPNPSQNGAGCSLGQSPDEHPHPIRGALLALFATLLAVTRRRHGLH